MCCRCIRPPASVAFCLLRARSERPLYTCTRDSEGQSQTQITQSDNTGHVGENGDMDDLTMGA